MWTVSRLGPFLDACEHNNKLLSSTEGIPRTSAVPNNTEKYYCLWQAIWNIMWRKKEELHTLPYLYSSYTLEGLVQFIFCTRQNSVHILTIVQVHTRSPADIQTPTYRNLIGHSMTALPPVLLPINTLPPPSSHCVVIPARKRNLTCISKMYFFWFPYSFKIVWVWQCVTWNCVR
jgi:hypothetical protein